MRRLLFVALALLAAPLGAQAADQTLLGKQILVKDPSTPDKRKIVLQAAEEASPNTVVGNPVANGATLSIAVYGGTAITQVFPLPSGTNQAGKPFWKGDATKGFTYKDAHGENGPVKIAKLKLAPNGTFQLKAVIMGKLGTIDVVPPNPGSGACARLQITGGDSYSVRFADGTMKNKAGKLFSVKAPSSEGSCLTCGNSFIDAGEACEVGASCGGTAVCQSDCTCPCDFLDPAECLYPFPSDYLTVADGSTDTGRRVNFHQASMPKNNANVPIIHTDYNRNDGFSPGTAMLLKVPGLNLAETEAAPITDIERSLDADAPILVINATTLQRHLIWAELDANASSDANRSLILRPAVNFEEGQRYIVALRNLKDVDGDPIAPSADFLAYRDNTPTGNVAKELRRPHMESIFSTLTAAGVARNELYLAWDFTVASQRNLTERLLFMRDDAFDRLGTSAPAFTVTSVENEVDGNIFRRVTGTYQVERYVDATTAPAKMILDANGLPTHQPTTQPASFICNIPRAALANAGATAVPARASIYGHGLLGSNTEVNGGNVKAMANEHNFVFCATKWIGMADEDVGNAVGILQDLGKFPSFTDRLQQAMVNQLFLARLMIHANGFVADPAFQDSFGNPVIDTSDVFYDGNSQGGIFGGTVMSIAQDITRGVLGVPGMNYSLLLTRSTDFTLYATFLYPAYPSELTHQLLLSLIQMLWDRSDPNGYAHHMTDDPLPNTPPHQVLLHLAFGDHQVANVATEVEARTIGASIHAPAIAPMRHTDVDPYYGIPAIPSYPFNGSALIVWDSGSPAPPIENLAPSMGTDPHSHPRNSVIGRQQKSDFLQTGGAVTDVCVGIPCVP
ncbi:MAG: hypothetical protein SF182_26335 [Deltaproteobacteria bacterium]|nr:hypothetical protein [Deltaproteobacteria bacterium]